MPAASGHLRAELSEIANRLGLACSLRTNESCENPLQPHKTLTPGRVPHVRPSVHGLNKMGDPDFLYAALDRTACAAFSKESRMKCIEADTLHRKSGGSPSKALIPTIRPSQME
jgi:hypothetical protein